MAKPILIVGGGPAGLAAAHSLATFGQECILVEKEDRLGGAPILEGYAKRQIELDTGGPRKIEMLMDLEELKEELSQLELTHALETERNIREGNYHNGIGAVVQIVGSRPG